MATPSLPSICDASADTAPGANPASALEQVGRPPKDPKLKALVDTIRMTNGDMFVNLYNILESTPLGSDTVVTFADNSRMLCGVFKKGIYVTCRYQDKHKPTEIAFYHPKAKTRLFCDAKTRVPKIETFDIQGNGLLKKIFNLE